MTVAVHADAILAQNPIPLHVWMAPTADRVKGDMLRRELGPNARILTTQEVLTQSVQGPAIMVVCPEDVMGRGNREILAICLGALPGRPVLYGGTGSKDVLIRAINHWRVSRAVPDNTPPSLLVDAIQKSHEALQTGRVLNRLVGDLRTRNSELKAAIERLREVQSQLLHTERLTTLGRIARGLTEAIRQHLVTLQLFEDAARELKGDAELTELLDYSFQGIHSITALLDEVMAYADHREKKYDLADEDLDDLIRKVVGFTRFDQLSRCRTIHQELGSGQTIRADRHRLYQVLINLFGHINVLDAAHRGSQVLIQYANLFLGEL